jgi:hypothetical protein
MDNFILINSFSRDGFFDNKCVLKANIYSGKKFYNLILILIHWNLSLYWMILWRK